MEIKKVEKVFEILQRGEEVINNKKPHEFKEITMEVKPYTQYSSSHKQLLERGLISEEKINEIYQKGIMHIKFYISKNRYE